MIRITTKILSLLLATHPSSPRKISSKFVDNFSSYPADRQIDKRKNIISLAEVIIIIIVIITRIEALGEHKVTNPPLKPLICHITCNNARLLEII